MSLLPDSASFFEEVQAFFLACRGDGVALADADARLISKWEATGVPAEIICQGIRASLVRHVFDGRCLSRPRSLRSCRREVEKEIQRFLSLHADDSRKNIGADPTSAPRAESTANDSPASPSSAGEISQTEADYSRQRNAQRRRQLASLEEEGKIPRKHLDFMASLHAPPAGSSDEGFAADSLPERFDDAVLIFQARCLPFAERAEIVRQAKEAAGPRKKMTTPRARAALLHRCLLNAIRDAEQKRRI